MKCLALVFVAFCVAAVPAHADKLGPGSTAVKQANDTISDLLAKKADASKVTASVNNFIDIDQLGQRAMGQFWAQLKPDEQKKFLQTLHALIEANYVKGMNNNVNYKVAYTGESQDASKNTVVTTKITTAKKGRPLEIEVDYVLDAKLHAFDIVTDGASLVDGYHDQFTSLMNNGGFTNVMTKMQTRLQQIQSSSATTPAAPAASSMPGTN
jgi:ABC-type transporter MlaC component